MFILFSFQHRGWTCLSPCKRIVGVATTGGLCLTSLCLGEVTVVIVDQMDVCK